MKKFKIGDRVMYQDKETVVVADFGEGYYVVEDRYGWAPRHTMNLDSSKRYAYVHAREISLLEPQVLCASASRNKYSPGQRLNSAAEVMQALLDGQHICDTNYP